MGRKLPVEEQKFKRTIDHGPRAITILEWRPMISRRVLADG
jgi:hypothetical protein